MKESIKISIITISYNAVQFIENAITSVIDQNYDNLEYIIIDGGSTDGTVDIIKKYQKHVHHWVSEKDNGISHAFNKGIKMATGNVIGILNADDYYLPETLSLINEHYHNAEVLYGKMRTVVNGKNEGDYIPDHALLEEDMTMCHPSTFIRKEVYDKFGDYDESYRLAMDYEILLRFFRCGTSFSFINKTLTVMNMEGISNQQWKPAFQEVIKAQDIHLGPSSKRRGLEQT